MLLPYHCVDEVNKASITATARATNKAIQKSYGDFRCCYRHNSSSKKRLF